MTVSGLCDNANFSETTLTRAMAFDLKPAWRRTIVLPSNEQMVIDSARDVAIASVKTEVVYTTQSANCAIDDLNAYATALDRFLSMANGAVSAIGICNELDTPGWTDSHGKPITDALIIAVAAQAAAVCRQHGVLALAPSLLTGPAEGRFAHIAAGLVGIVDAMVVHPYFRSIGGFPRPGWIYGTVEEAAADCARLGGGLPTWFDEAGCTTIYEGIGQQGQADYTTALRHFQHPSVPVICQFALHDGVGGPEELNQGKDWGLMGYGLVGRKDAYRAYAAAAPLVPTPEPPPPDPDPEPSLAAREAAFLDLWQAATYIPAAAVAYNPDSAFAKFWRQHPEIGSPVGPERADDEGVYQAFTVGGVMQWMGGDEIGKAAVS